MKKVLFPLVLSSLLTACTLPSFEPVRITSSYNAQQAQKMLTGTSTITGSAFMRQNGGGVVTCAGQTVTLIPATAYATERMTGVFGQNLSEVHNSYSMPKIEPDLPEFKKNVRTETCDAQGNFEFKNVGAGEFYVHAIVIWHVGYHEQGGRMVAKVSVANGETKKVMLSR